MGLPLPVVGGLIGAGANLLGGMIGARASRSNTEDQINYAREQNAESAALQREFARNGIRWRVQDAIEAGLHPLFALGGAGAAYTPSASAVTFDNGARDMGRAISAAGQDLGRAVAAQATPEERAAQALQLKAIEASIERDFAQASYWRAQAAKIVQGASNPAMPSDVVMGAYSGVQTQAVDVEGRTRVEAHPLFRDAVKLTPDEMASRDFQFDGQTAGRKHPGMRDFEFPGGFRALLPATGQGGIPEEIDITLLPLILGANIERHGWRWIVDLMGYMTGRTPEERRGRTLESWIRKGRMPKAEDFGLPMRGR